MEGLMKKPPQDARNRDRAKLPAAVSTSRRSRAGRTPPVREDDSPRPSTKDFPVPAEPMFTPSVGIWQAKRFLASKSQIPSSPAFHADYVRGAAKRPSKL